MIHCVNCDFHLPQHYVAACPYCGLDPRILGEKPSTLHQSSQQSTTMTLEPLSETLLSFGGQSGITASTAHGFSSANRLPARSSYQPRAKERKAKAGIHKQDAGDGFFGKIVMMVVLITLATVAFEFRHLIAEFLK